MCVLCSKRGEVRRSSWLEKERQKTGAVRDEKERAFTEQGEDKQGGAACTRE